MISKETLEVRPSLFDEIRKNSRLLVVAREMQTPDQNTLALCFPLLAVALLGFAFLSPSCAFISVASLCFPLLCFASVCFLFLRFPLLPVALLCLQDGIFPKPESCVENTSPVGVASLLLSFASRYYNLFRSVALCFAVRLLPLALLRFASRRFPLLALVRVASLAMFCFCLTLLCLKLAKEGYDDYSASGCRKCNANFRKETKERKCRHPFGL